MVEHSPTILAKRGIKRPTVKAVHKTRQITSDKVRLADHGTRQFVLEEDWEKMKRNEQGRQR